MRTRANVLGALVLAVAGLVAGCGGHPKVRYSTGDRNAVSGRTEEWNFDRDEVGKPPAGADVFDGSWQVLADADGTSAPHVLCQSGTATYPAIRFGDKVYSDLSATVRFKPISGDDDRAAGIIFRVQDKDNYYILRANALEDSVEFFRYAGGTRSSIKSGSVKVASGQWQELKLEVEGNRFRGFLDGRTVVEATDDAYSAGGVGLWTKADSRTCFDDFRVTAK